MEDSDRARFAALLRKVCAAYQTRYSDDLVDVYWSALHDQPFDRVHEALRAGARRNKWMPRAAELRAIALDRGEYGRVTDGSAPPPERDTELNIRSVREILAAIRSRS